jgi:hypothetical protein
MDLILDAWDGDEYEPLSPVVTTPESSTLIVGPRDEGVLVGWADNIDWAPDIAQPWEEIDAPIDY